MQRVAARCEACWHKRYRPDAPQVPHTCNRVHPVTGRSLIVNPAKEDWCTVANGHLSEACNAPAPYRLLNGKYGVPRCVRHAQLAAIEYQIDMP